MIARKLLIKLSFIANGHFAQLRGHWADKNGGRWHVSIDGSQQGKTGQMETAPVANVARFMRQYLSLLAMRPKRPRGRVPDKLFRNEVDFWHEAHTHLLATVRLEGFRIADWFPRAPGVAHSAKAQEVHKAWYGDQPSAWEYTLLTNRRSTEETIRAAQQWDPLKDYVDKANLATRMIEEGGFGTVRLLPARLNGDDYWFGTAVAFGIIALGIPIAIPAPCLQKVEAPWSAMVNLVGKVRLLSDAGLGVIANEVHHAPPIIVLVEEMVVTKRSHDIFEPRMMISPVVLLERDTHFNQKNLEYAFVEIVYSGSNLYAEPEARLSKLASRLHGTILTNYDQVIPSLAGAPLSYQRLLEKQFDRQLLLRLADDGGRLSRSLNKIDFGRVSVSNYTFNAPVGAAGDGARSDGNLFIQQSPNVPIDVVQLAQELANVHKGMKAQANNADAAQQAEITAVAQAQAAASDGKPSEALNFLKAAGKWTLDVSKSVAAKIVEDAVKGELSSS